MTVEKAQKFRALVNVLVSQGFNLWDARIEARRLLNIKMFEQRDYRGRVLVSSKLAFRLNDTDRNRPENIPTIEDRLDLYFWSIVATCKSVIFGTAVFRSFSEFSQSWNDEAPAARNRGRYSIHSQIAMKERKNNYKPLNRPRGFWRMVRLLEANGLTLSDAKEKAQSVLTGEYPAVSNDSVQTL